MYCQECGTYHDDDAIFCGECGVRLDKGEPVQSNVEPAEPIIDFLKPTVELTEEPIQPAEPTVQSTVKKAATKPKASLHLSKTSMVLIVEALVLVLVICGMAFLAKKCFTPEQEAVNYFVNIANGEWEKAYEKLDVVESEFINANTFAAANKYNSLGVINAYQVREIQDEEMTELLYQQTALGRDVYIDYRLKGSTYDSTYMVSLNKQPEKQYLFFDSWKVGTSNLICENFYVYVPTGAVVTIDGTVLSDAYAVMTDGTGTYAEEQITEYIMPQIFMGAHEITVTMEGKQTVTETIHIASSYYEYYLTQMYWTEEAMQELIQTAEASMQQIYAAAMDGQPLESISSLFTTHEFYLEEIQYDYKYLQESLRDTAYVPVKISFSDMQGSMYDTETTVTIDFTYEVEYYYENWWTSAMEQDIYVGSEQWYFNFVKENGKWVLTNLGCETLYY